MGAAAGRVYACTKIAPASTADDANPITGPDCQILSNQILSNQRGSNILSETNAIRCGGSSSASTTSAARVASSRFISSRQSPHAAKCFSTPARSPAFNSPRKYAFKSTDEQLIAPLPCEPEPNSALGDRARCRDAT